MGSKVSLMSDEEIRHVQEKTHFDFVEAKEMYKRFQQQVPNGLIKKGEFTKLMDSINIKDKMVIEMLFRAFDENKDGSINFREFLVSMSIMTRGTFDQKLDFSFGMFDLDGNGFISKEELGRIAETFFKMIRGKIALRDGSEFPTSKAFVDKFFDEFDANHDGKISKEVSCSYRV
eukprot:TRINITY_DN12178_c0_g1_i1.p1 TRINITY_DN12178_c0_g1~~TRINITY_DN12178_c0_g1_i1.p1  ORF type:complete len:175 (+),score=58.75 TRINITY_DN12178_c0_g1_i1:114-638(+)